MVLAEGGAVAGAGEVGVEAFVAQCCQIARRVAVKPPQVTQHGPKARAQGIALLSEKPAQSAARILARAAIKRDCERHFGRIRGFVQVPQHGGQVRIGLLVENDKAGVHWDTRHVDRIAVPADPPVSFKQRNPVPLAEQPSRRKPRNSAADHGDTKRRAARQSGAQRGYLVAVHAGKSSCWTLTTADTHSPAK